MPDCTTCIASTVLLHGEFVDTRTVIVAVFLNFVAGGLMREEHTDMMAIGSFVGPSSKADNKPLILLVAIYYRCWCFVLVRMGA